jgi:phage/plasmid-associated DNA primase
VLAWAVEGYRDWREAGGLNPPKAVVAAVADYREAQDPLLDFVETKLIFDPSAWTPVAEIFAAYGSYCVARSVPAIQRLSVRLLGDNLVARGGVERGQAPTSRRERSLFGVKLRRDEDLTFLD